MTIDAIKREIDYYVDCNFEKLREEVNVIVGVSRGGLIPAALIATKLDKPLFAAYIDRNDNIDFDRKEEVKNKNILVVDDIVRSGRTLSLLNDHFIKTGIDAVNYLTVYSVKDLSIEKYYHLDIVVIRELDKDIEFPWDYPRIADNNA